MESNFIIKLLKGWNSSRCQDSIVPNLLSRKNFILAGLIAIIALFMVILLVIIQANGY